MTRTSRRSLLKALASSALTLPLAGLFEKISNADTPSGIAKRFLVLYHPDGVPAPPGEASKWMPTGSGSAVTLPECLQPLAAYQASCVFTRNLSMGPTDSGSHPGGAKKLLTAVDGGNGESIDRYLARTVGAGAPFKHVYLGAMANQNNASGDKFVSYPSPGTTVAPEDDPHAAFARIFASAAPPPTGDPGLDRASILDTALADLNDLRSQLGDAEKAKLDLHTDALRDVEQRIKAVPPPASCGNAPASLGNVDGTKLYEPGLFPTVLTAQLDLMVQAMACGMTQVGVVQASQHTSELIMSRFPGTPMYTPSYDMRSHQASHYGQSSDPKYLSYTEQRTWFVSQLAYLMDQLKQRPEGAGTMLDNTIVLFCTEISDGNTHSHDDMPFILAGGAGGAYKTGRMVDVGYRRHADMLVSIARAMGDGMTSFGQGGSGPRL